MALNFPSSPTLNQTYTDGTTVWKWNGSAWDVKRTPQTNTSELNNDSGFITSSALTGYALTNSIPTDNSQLTNGAGYATTTATNTALALKAPLASPTFTGTVSGITKAMVGLGSVDNTADASKNVLYATSAGSAPASDVSAWAKASTKPTYTASEVGLGNVANESKATMFTDPTFTGTVSGITKAMVGLGNVTNESKATMFTSPTFTGTVSGVTATAVGLGNVTNESKATMFSSPTFTGTVSGVTATMVGLGNVTNESKSTMFTQPSFTSQVSISGGGAVWPSFTPLLYITSTANNAVMHLGANVGSADIAMASNSFKILVNNTEILSTTANTSVSLNIPTTIAGTATLQQSTEVLNTKTSSTGVVAHDFSTGSIWYHTSISANFTANFTNVPTTDNRTIVCTLVLVQGATAYVPNAVQIGGTAQTIKWLGNATPSGTANKVEIVSFTLFRTGGAWSAVTGSLSSYG